MKRILCLIVITGFLAACAKQNFPDQNSPDATIRKYLFSQYVTLDEARFAECFRGVSKSKVESTFEILEANTRFSRELNRTFGDDYLEEYNLYGLKGSITLSPVLTQAEIEEITIKDLKKENSQEYTYANGGIWLTKSGESWYIVEPYRFVGPTTEKIRDQHIKALEYIENRNSEDLRMASIKNYMVNHIDEPTFFVDIFQREKKTIIDELQVTPGLRKVYSIPANQELKIGFSTSLSPMHYDEEIWPFEINQINGNSSTSSIGGASTSFEPKNGVIDFEVNNRTDFSYGATIYITP